MKEIIVHTQKELEKIALDFEGYIYIEGGTESDPLTLSTNFQKAEVVVRGKAYLYSVSDSAQIRYVYDSAQIGSVSDSAQIEYVYDSAQIRSVYDSAQIRSVSGSAQIRSVYDSAQIRSVSGSAQIRSVSGSAQIESVYDSAQIESVYDSAQIRSVSDSAQIEYVYDSAQIEYVYDSAQIRSVYDSAQIRSVSGSAQIRYVYDSAQIGSVSDSAQIEYVYDSAQIRSVSGSAQIEYVYDSAQIRSVYDSAQIELYGEAVVSGSSAKKIVCHGYNTVIVHKSDKSKLNLVINKNSHLVLLPDNTLQTKPTFNEFASRYPVDLKGTKATLYKAVHKINGRYIADYDKSFEYKIGEVHKVTCAPAKDGACSPGLHVSVKYWALKFGEGWEDMALLECEVAAKNIVVSKDTDGKVRTPELKVIREVPKSEY